MAVYISNIYKMPVNVLHYSYAIVQSYNGGRGIIQCKALAPSQKLFYKYLDLRKKGMWNKESFCDIYVPTFIRDFVMSQEALSDIKRIKHFSDMGCNIGLGCFCADETICHRSIEAGILQGLGCEVITETGNDYTHYYELFKKVRNEVLT